MIKFDKETILLKTLLLRRYVKSCLILHLLNIRTKEYIYEYICDLISETIEPNIDLLRKCYKSKFWLSYSAKEIEGIVQSDFTNLLYGILGKVGIRSHTRFCELDLSKEQIEKLRFIRDRMNFNYEKEITSSCNNI